VLLGSRRIIDSSGPIVRDEPITPSTEDVDRENINLKLEKMTDTIMSKKKFMADPPKYIDLEVQGYYPWKITLHAEHETFLVYLVEIPRVFVYNIIYIFKEHDCKMQKAMVKLRKLPALWQIIGTDSSRSGEVGRRLRTDVSLIPFEAFGFTLYEGV
jgi:hypothetical protein